MKATDAVPPAQLGLIGGSSTFSLDFPETLADEVDVWVTQNNLVFATPYGESPPFKLIELSTAAGLRQALTVRMHGWRAGVSRADASRQVFWVFREAGVRRILAEGGVGAVNHLLRPRDVMVCTDYLDHSMRRDVSLTDDYLCAMRRPTCSVLRARLVAAAEAHGPGRVFARGVYAVTDGRHFESPAEVRMLRLLGADVIGQSMAPEVYLAREIGACYARVDLVVNYAEGVVEEWSHDDLREIFSGDARAMGRILLEAASALNNGAGDECGCRALRWPTLLR